jgi:head-tail adaptor
MPVIASGQRTLSVTIQHATQSKGSTGMPIETFADTTPPVWMSREAAQSFDRTAEGLRGAQITARAYHRWTMPYLASMDPDLVDVAKARRLKYQGRFYDIVEAQRDGYRAITLTTLVKAA